LSAISVLPLPKWPTSSVTRFRYKPFLHPKKSERPGHQHNPAGVPSTRYVKFFTNTSLVLRRSYSNILLPSWVVSWVSSVPAKSLLELALRLLRPRALHRYETKVLDPLVATFQGTQGESEETSDTDILFTE